jgi:hypothetical protein
MKTSLFLLSFLIISPFLYALDTNELTTLRYSTIPEKIKDGLITNYYGFIPGNGERRFDNWGKPFDYQGAVFGEYSQDQYFLLYATVFEIEPAQSGFFAYYCYLGRGSKVSSDIICFQIKGRIPQLSVDQSAVFLCSYNTSQDESFTMGNGVVRQFHVPWFDAERAAMHIDYNE